MRGSVVICAVSRAHHSTMQAAMCCSMYMATGSMFAHQRPRRSSLPHMYAGLSRRLLSSSVTESTQHSESPPKCNDRPNHENADGWSSQCFSSLLLQLDYNIIIWVSHARASRPLCTGSRVRSAPGPLYEHQASRPRRMFLFQGAQPSKHPPDGGGSTDRDINYAPPHQTCRKRSTLHMCMCLH